MAFLTPESATSSQLSQISSSSSSAAILTSDFTYAPAQWHALTRLNDTVMSTKMASLNDAQGKEDSISRGSIEVCRLMRPDDANISGNVHGGTILKLIEQGGFIIATRHCNKNGKEATPVLAALVRVERTDFLQPMYIGEVAQVHVELGYASRHSLEVKSFVWAENLVTGSRRLTNLASLWYVPVIVGSEEAVISEVPALKYQSKEEEERGRLRYETQKKARLEKKEDLKEVRYRCLSKCVSK